MTELYCYGVMCKFCERIQTYFSYKKYEMDQNIENIKDLTCKNNNCDSVYMYVTFAISAQRVLDEINKRERNNG